MNIRLHISYPSNTSPSLHKRAWLLPDSIRLKCVLVLGGDSNNPDSIPTRKGYMTHSQETVSIDDLLQSLKREYVTIPEGTTIHYKKALIKGGFEYILEQVHGAWTFTAINNLLLDGYTEENISSDKCVYSVGRMRKINSLRSESGPRYLLKYDNEKKKYADISDILEFEQYPKTAQSKCHLSDELDTLIF